MKLKRSSTTAKMVLLATVAFAGFFIYHAMTTQGLNRQSATLAPVTFDRNEGQPLDEAMPDKPVADHSDSTESGTASIGSEDRGEIWIVLNERPDIAYLRFQGRAKAGDASAQLMLTEILERCRYSSVKTPEKLARLEARGDLPAEMLAQFRANLDECGGLYNLLREYDLDSLWALWMEEASDKLPVARVALSLASLEVEYSDELYRQLQAGISGAKGDWIQERIARQQAFSFFRQFVEPTQYDPSIQDSGYYMRGEDTLAWDYLHCKNSVHCDLKAFKQQAADNYYEYQINDMYKRANELDRALEEGDWARLGLKRMPDNG